MQEDEQAPGEARRADVRIERATWRDLRAIAGIQASSFRPGLAYGILALSTLRVFPGVVFLVARTGTSPVAGCIIGDHHRGNGRIMNLAVAPGERRKGVASALLGAIEARLTNGDMVLMAEEWNTGAQALYEGQGYVRDGKARDYYGKDRHGIWMRKARRGTNAPQVRV